VEANSTDVQAPRAHLRPPHAAVQAGPPRDPEPAARVLGWSAAAGIGLAILIMIAVSAAGPSRAVVSAPAPPWGPPWWLPVHPSAQLVTVALWTATVTGGGGVIAGVAAVALGARPPVRALLAAAFTAAAILAVLPPAGSTDSLDYAAYGRMAVLGHSPYVMTPLQLRSTGDPVGEASPRSWKRQHSSYGPLATAQEWAAAELGGTSALRITFWLKLWNALAFGAVALALDRLLRSSPGRRARAHLIWTANPLLMWGLVAGGHIDGLAAAIGFFGLIALSRGRRGRPGVPGPLRCLAAGALVGTAADLKITYILFGLAVIWAARRSRAALLAAAAGALAVLVPSYLCSGRPAVAALTAIRGLVTADNYYQFFSRMLGYPVLPHLTLIAELGFVIVAAVLLRRIPAGPTSLPAVRPALALSLAWLLVWPYQESWYAAMALCLLALYPASRLDWPVLALQAVASLINMPGLPGGLPAGWLTSIADGNEGLVAPVVRLAALLVVVALCVSASWHTRPNAEPPPAELGG
jgi:hypothetical protein